jgi:hypothetical protein
MKVNEKPTQVKLPDHAGFPIDFDEQAPPNSKIIDIYSDILHIKRNASKKGKGNGNERSHTPIPA